jgi:hypothetical protein
MWNPDILFSLLVLLSLSQIFGLRITPVPDGVVVQERGNARAKSGELDRYVRVELPDVIEVFSEFEPLITSAKKLAENASISDTLYFVKRRLAEMEMIIAARKAPSRSKRGLIDLFGKIGKTLFGIATEADVEMVRAMTSDVSRRTTQLRTAHNQVVGTVNHLAKVFEEMESKIENIDQLVSDVQQYQKQMSTALGLLDTAATLDSLTSWLELLLSELQNSLEKQFRRADHCQGGIVSDELIPRELFKEIRVEFGTDSTLADQWYYQYLKVDYYFEEDNAVIGKFKIPILTTETYFELLGQHFSHQEK